MTHDIHATSPTREDLVAGLHARGVCYLAPTPHGDELNLNDDELIVGIAQAEDARLRFGLAALFLGAAAVAIRLLYALYALSDFDRRL